MKFYTLLSYSSTFLILMLLLDKDQLRLWILLALSLKEVEGKGADLLDSGDGNLLLEGGSPPGLHQVIVYLQGLIHLLLKQFGHKLKLFKLTKWILPFPVQNISFWTQFGFKEAGPSSGISRLISFLKIVSP